MRQARPTIVFSILSIGLWLAIAATPASALTLLQLSGSGDIAIDVTGSIALDTGGNLFDTISLSAGSDITLGSGAATPDTVLSLSGQSDYTASFADDLSLQIVSWSGSLTLSATQSISVSGSLLASGSIAASAPGSIALSTVSFGSDPGSPGGTCDVTGIDLSVGAPLVPSGSCGDLSVTLAPGGGGIVVSGGPVLVVPEPDAALLFAVGLGLVRARRRTSLRARATDAA